MPQVIRGVLPLLTILTLSIMPGVAGPASGQEQQRCFNETGFCVSERFLEFWQQNGGLAVFGYPITPARQQTNPDGDTVLTQYFERQRFELHPENPRPYDVLLGRLGAPIVATADPPIYREREAGPKPGCMWFAATGFNVCNDQGFAAYWRTNGLRSSQLDNYQQSLALFGYPLSRLAPAGPGSPIYVQYFERARFEYHPNNPDPYKVLLGRLGADTLFRKPNQPGVGRVVFVKNDGLYIMHEDGSNQQRILAPDALGSPSYVFFSEPEWSPDATKIAFQVGLLGDVPPLVYVVNADGSNPRRLAQDARDVQWSPDGSRILFSRISLPLLDPIDAASEIVVANADGSSAKILTGEDVYAFAPAWSPDGSRIAYLTGSNERRPEQMQLYIMNADGSNQRTLSTSGINAFDWSPDGTQIVFSRVAAGVDNSELFSVNIGGGSVTRLTSTPQFEGGPRWSPDGSQIAFVRVPAGEPPRGHVPNSDIYMINANGSGDRALVMNPEGAIDPVWISGGHVPSLLYQTFDTESQAIYRLAGQGSTKLADGYQPDFTAR